jgi:uncharacterized protein
MLPVLERIASALERLAPAPLSLPDWSTQRVFVWQPQKASLKPVAFSPLPLALLKGIEPQIGALQHNTKRFAQNMPANHALLWGARGTGKSSLVKAVYAACANLHTNLVLIEVRRDDLPTLPLLLELLENAPIRAILFCDDLSFETEDASYKALKALLDGGVDSHDNILFYATSNRRHLMPRFAIENERSTALHPDEAVEEKVSLSDRFGLWLGFHSLDQETYLAIVRGYAETYGITLPLPYLERQALQWSLRRGARSGRVAWQFIASVR